MNAIEIISKIRTAGGSITVDDGKITITAPAGAITAADRVVIAEHRETLISILSPTDPEREAIVWADTPAADGALDQAHREWAEIERVIDQTFMEGGIEVEARFDRTPEPIAVETVQDGEWTQPDRGQFVIPAGTEGRLVVDLNAVLVDDPRELWEMERTISTERSRGGDPVVVDLAGRVRVLDRTKIRLRATA